MNAIFLIFFFLSLCLFLSCIRLFLRLLCFSFTRFTHSFLCLFFYSVCYIFPFFHIRFFSLLQSFLISFVRSSFIADFLYWFHVFFSFSYLSFLPLFVSLLFSSFLLYFFSSFFVLCVISFSFLFFPSFLSFL